MKELSITALAKIIDTRVIASHDAGQNVTSVSTDSRTVTPGDCFFAIIGPNFDGHNFLADAFAKGASCAVVSKDVPPFVAQRRRVPPNQFPDLSGVAQAKSDKIILKVEDTVKALGVLASWYRKDCNFKVIAITGSVGKTTTREIIHHVLSAVGETSPMGGSKRFKTFQSPKNFNNFIGLPLSILTAPADSQILVLELATNHPGEIEYLSRIAAPDIALITNVAPAHIEGFHDLESLAKEKLSISEGLNPSGILIINADCPVLFTLAHKQHKRFLSFGSKEHCDYRAYCVHYEGLSSDFELDGADIHLPLPGRGNVENALAAWAVCSTLGISERDFADAVKTISPVSMRTEMLKLGSLTVISDCYNANPASMKNALDILATLAKKENRRAVFVCGDMAELGNQTEKFHVELGRFIASSNVNLLLTVGHLALLAADTSKNESPLLETHSFTQSAQLCDNLHKLIKDSDIILVKGSRINKLETVVEKLKAIYPGS
jgi:UDP-N-acetylmuramoyl-tripeptide--D-alanyl-D-alanine ligase